jgi:hypothetical protein
MQVLCASLLDIRVDFFLSPSTNPEIDNPESHHIAHRAKLSSRAAFPSNPAALAGGIYF